MFRLLSGELLHCYLFVQRRPEWENSRQPLPQATQPELDELVRTGVVYACACVHGGWTDINTGTCIYWFSTRLASVRGAICQWVGCLIGNQYVCLDSFLLIIVLFSTVQLICSKVLLLAFWPFHLNFHGWLVSYHYNMSKNLILYILCQNIMQ